MMPCFGTWISAFRHLEPVLGRKCHVESEFEVHFVFELQHLTFRKNEIYKQIMMFGDISVSLMRSWTKLGGFFSYKHPGSSHTAQGPQKQPEILKDLLAIYPTQ